MSMYFSLMGRVELIPTQYSKCSIMQYITVFHSTLSGYESHRTCQWTPLCCWPIWQHSCITRVVCYKKQTGAKVCRERLSSMRVDTLQEKKRKKRLCTQIHDGILSSYWHLKSESPAVSGIPTKAAQERCDSDSVAICSDFWEENAVQSFVPMQTLRSRARRGVTWHTNAVVTFPETHRKE